MTTIISKGNPWYKTVNSFPKSSPFRLRQKVNSITVMAREAINNAHQKHLANLSTLNKFALYIFEFAFFEMHGDQLLFLAVTVIDKAQENKSVCRMYFVSLELIFKNRIYVVQDEISVSQSPTTFTIKSRVLM